MCFQVLNDGDKIVEELRHKRLHLPHLSRKAPTGHNLWSFEALAARCSPQGWIRQLRAHMQDSFAGWATMGDNAKACTEVLRPSRITPKRQWCPMCCLCRRLHAVTRQKFWDALHALHEHNASSICSLSPAAKQAEGARSPASVQTLETLTCLQHVASILRDNDDCKEGSSPA